MNLLNQLQALQAVQGLQELKPKGRGKKYRFDIPEDPKERASKRRWLTFKADWLEAILEDTLDELEALNRSEGPTSDLRQHTRRITKISASYEITIDKVSGKYKPCKVVDISVGGARLLLNEPINVNSALKFSLEEDTVLEGVVVWSRKIQAKEEQYNTGIMFKDLNNVLINKIEKIIDEKEQEYEK